MGLLVDGMLRDQWSDTKASGGRFERSPAQFRHWIGSGGKFPPEAGRYRLYVSWACPWAHRTLIYRRVKGLENAIEASYVEPLMLEKGWTLREGADPDNGALFLWQIYAKADPHSPGESLCRCFGTAFRRRS